MKARNYVAKHARTCGAGVHQDKKKNPTRQQSKKELKNSLDF